MTAQRLLTRAGIVLVLVICLGGHVSELLDFWDHTLQTGKDIDYSLVGVAVLMGVVFVSCGRALRSFENGFEKGKVACLPSLLCAASVDLSFGNLARPSHSPPQSLRI